METIEVTSLSTKGQVVIPQSVREGLDLHPGNKFVVIGEGDTIILKMIHKPSFDHFDDLLAKSRKFARKKGLKKSDIEDAIKSVRHKKK